MPLSLKISKNYSFKLKTQVKKPPVLHKHILMCCACSLLQSGGLVCLATLGGSCLHSGGSWRPGVPSLVLLPGYPSLVTQAKNKSILKQQSSFFKSSFISFNCFYSTGNADASVSIA